MTAPYQRARSQGYSDEEIMSHIESHPKYSEKIKKARSQGYNDSEISEYLSSYQPKKEKSTLEKGARIAAQVGIGAAERAAMSYEIGAASLSDKDAQTLAYKQNVMEDIERLTEQKQTGVWDEKDQELLDHSIDQIKHPEKAEQFSKTGDVGIRGLIEKATGVDLHPEGILEKAANWIGFIKNPKNIVKTGLKPKEFIKAIMPTGEETLRGLGAGAALEMAEQGEFGPIGTMAAVVAGDLAGAGASGLLKGAKALVTEPKKTLAKIGASFTSKDKLELQKEIIKDYREADIQADLGTITDNNLIKWTQARIAQSGLVGKAADDFRQELTTQIKEEYKNIAANLGKSRFSTTSEAGEVLKDGLKKIREAD